MTNKLALAIVIGLAGTAAAQEGDPFGKAMEGAPPPGVRTGPPRVPDAPPAGARADQQFSELEALTRQAEAARRAEGAAPAARQPVAVVDAGPAGPAAAEVDDSGEINANYDVTMATYQKILEGQSSDTGAVDKRIAANEEIVTRYKPELLKCEEEQRKAQVDFMSRAFQLRQQKDAGSLSEDGFQRAIMAEEGKANRRRAQVAADVAFYREEISEAERRLAELRGQKKAVDERLAREGRTKPKKKAPGEALFEGYSAQLERLSGFQTRFTMDGVGTPDMFMPRSSAPVIHDEDGKPATDKR